MKVIGHRGAAGLALENTVDAIKAGIAAGVDSIEFDIRLTKDEQLVLVHDADLGRISRHSYHLHDHVIDRLPFLKRFPRIHEQSAKRLKQLALREGLKIATLEEAIKAVGNTPIIIDGKGNNWAKSLVKFLRSQESLPPVYVCSFDKNEIVEFHNLMPEIPIYITEFTHALEAIRLARLTGLYGISLNFWLLNPFTYLLARFHHLEINVYTVNQPWLAALLSLLYPKVGIITNVPHKMQFLRPKLKR